MLELQCRPCDWPNCCRCCSFLYHWSLWTLTSLFSWCYLDSKSTLWVCVLYFNSFITFCNNICTWHESSVCVCVCVDNITSWHSGCPTSFSLEPNTTTHTSRPTCYYKPTCLACSCLPSCSPTLKRFLERPFDWYKPVSTCSVAKASCRRAWLPWSSHRWSLRPCGRKTRILSSCRISRPTWLNGVLTRLLLHLLKLGDFTFWIRTTS